MQFSSFTVESLTCFSFSPPIVTVTDDNKDEQEGKGTQSGDNGGDEEKLEELPGKPAKQAASPASSEFKKTWGFRRTTIAKREMPGEAVAAAEGPVRRSGRQAKRTDKLEEFLLTAKRGRGGGGRRSAPANMEGGGGSSGGDPPSQTPTDIETASEASFDGSAEVKMSGSKTASQKKRKTVRKGRGRQTRSTKAKQEEEEEDEEEEEEGASEDEGSSEDEAAGGAQDAQIGVEQEEKKPEITIDAAEGAATPSQDEQADAEKTEVVKEEDEAEEVEECKKKLEETNRNSRPSRNPARACKDSTPSKRDEDDEDEDESSSSSSSSDEGSSNDEGYDPNALYCICRQKHNKR